MINAAYMFVGKVSDTAQAERKKGSSLKWNLGIQHFKFQIEEEC